MDHAENAPGLPGRPLHRNRYHRAGGPPADHNPRHAHRLGLRADRRDAPSHDDLVRGGELRAWYGHGWTPEGDRLHTETMRNYIDFLLEHRLGPGGETSLDEKSLGYLIGKGMNAFIMGTAPNLGREHKTEYSKEFIEQFTRNIRAASKRLAEKGWLDKAYVYVYDEAPKSAWPEVRRSTGRSNRPPRRPAPCSASTSRRASRN